MHSVIRGVDMLRRLIRGRRGSVALVVSMASLAIIGVAAFSVDLGNAYSSLNKDQQIADAAAYSGALAYSQNQTSASVNNAVSRIATLNGLPSSAITGSVVSSPSGDGNSAIQATVRTTNPIYLASALSGGSSMSISATAYAEMKGGTAGCITAIQASGQGISVTGGTSITASGCAVASNGTVPGQNSSVYTTCGTTITTSPP